MNFGDYLNKYGIKWNEKYLSYAWEVYPNRTLTGIVAHTEGLASISDRSEDVAVNGIYNYFNNKANQANSNCYITLSGNLYLFIPVENGNWSNGNANDNFQTFTFELQDNGRWNNASTYTQAQYRAVAGLYCALYDLTRDSSFASKSTPILFEHSARGIRPHNQITPSRACPGAFDWKRTIGDAQKLWNEVNVQPQPPTPVDDYKKMYEEAVKEIDRLKKEIERLNKLIEGMAKEIDNKNIQIANLQKAYDELAELNKKLINDLQTAQKQIKEFQNSIFYFFYKLWHKNRS